MIQRFCRRLPPSLRDRLPFIGPGLLLAITVSGESGLAEILLGGAEHGFSLLWVVLAALIFKFAFTTGIARYTVATGEDIFQGLRRIPGPRNWEVAFIMLIYTMEMVAYGGIAAISGIFLCALTGLAVSSDVFALLTLVLVFALLWMDNYSLVERVTVAMAIGLVAGTLISLFSISLPVHEVASGLVPAVHDHMLVEIMALMGAVGGGLNILLYSGWLHRKIGDRHGEANFRRFMAGVNLDLVLAFLLIGVAAIGFLALGWATTTGAAAHEENILTAVWTVLDDIPLATEIFLITGYFTLMGGIIGGVDGRASAIASILRSTTDTRHSEKHLYRGGLLVFAFIIVIAVFFDEPTLLIRSISALASIAFAVTGFILLYLDTHLPSYARGSPLWTVVMAAGSLLFLLMALLKEATILQFGVPLLERIAVVVLVIYLISGSGVLRGMVVRRLTLTDQVWLVLIFGMLSVYGTFRGIEVGGLIVNFRDLGPLIAGIIGGPIVGACAGLIGGAYRYGLGGWTVLPCSLSPVVAGIIAGMLSRRWHGRFTYFRLFGLSVLVEVIHILVLVPLLTGAPLDLVIATARTTLLTMILSNACGLILFQYVVRERGIEGLNGTWIEKDGDKER
ncbi:Nramp family divalent metal transporter [Methanofollis fontis]|uniref:Histidine kinase n=1 Tax=Methanofollis fontis TaxID=2052832 RepID=A0A483CWE1_9EURY|nr:Nramp family divalent metal transporter [Methanofollis fontis]TAJ45500.1 histidine kinase [Methanofollis fontis]